MKKISSFVAVILFAIAFTSCKKEYMCKCTFKTGSEQPFYAATGLGKTTEDDAKAVCEKMKGTVQAKPNESHDYTCELEERSAF